MKVRDVTHSVRAWRTVNTTHAGRSPTRASLVHVHYERGSVVRIVLVARSSSFRDDAGHRTPLIVPP